MKQPRHNTDEQIRFVARHYRENLFDSRKGWEKLSASLPGFGKSVPTFRRTSLAVAASLLAILSIGILITANRPKQLLAQTHNVRFSLPDQTEILMHKGARLSYRRTFGNADRMVSMRGAIRFNVTRNETNPFTVATPTATITVLGTLFDLAENDEGTSLAVLSGKVRFTPQSPAIDILCTAGTRISYKAAGEEIDVSTDHSSIRYSARLNNLSIRNATLAQLVPLLSLYYNTKLELPREELPLRLTASFSGKNIDEIVSLVNFTLDTHLSVTKPQ